MINIALIIAETIICYILLIYAYKKYKMDGLYFFIIIATFISCIMNLKTISIMNIGVPLGFGITTSVILGANFLTQKQGLPQIKNYILIVLITIIITCGVLNLSSIIPASEYSYLSNKAYDNVFTHSIKMHLALLISLIVSITICTNVFYTTKRLKNKIILSNIFSVVITEFFENIVFVIIAYYFDYTGIDIILCIIFRYTIKSLIGIIGTIPLYIMNKNS